MLASQAFRRFAQSAILRQNSLSGQASLARSFSVSSSRKETFTVQDEEDFQKRVIAMDVGIKAVPTVIAFKDGKPVDKFVGLLDRDGLGSFIEKLYVD